MWYGDFELTDAGTHFCNTRWLPGWSREDARRYNSKQRDALRSLAAAFGDFYDKGERIDIAVDRFNNTPAPFRDTAPIKIACDYANVWYLTLEGIVLAKWMRGRKNFKRL